MINSIIEAPVFKGHRLVNMLKSIKILTERKVKTYLGTPKSIRTKQPLKEIWKKL